MKPSEIYCCTECAWKDICRGCPEERGWTGEKGKDPAPVGEMCEGILDIYMDEDCLVMVDQKPICRRRANMESRS